MAKEKKVEEERDLCEKQCYTDNSRGGTTVPRFDRPNEEEVIDNMDDQAVKNIAQQIAQQVGEQVGQAVSQAISKVLQSQTQTTGTSGSQTTMQEKMGDIGGTERLEKDNMDNSGILFSNQKRTYDEYQHESLESIKRNRSYVDKILSDAHSYDNQARNVANQALQNAVETANMVGKQAVRHSDIAIDREWNVDEQGYTAAEILRVVGFKQAIMAAVATAVNDNKKASK